MQGAYGQLKHALGPDSALQPPLVLVVVVSASRTTLNPPCPWWLQRSQTKLKSPHDTFC